MLNSRLLILGITLLLVNLAFSSPTHAGVRMVQSVKLDKLDAAPNTLTYYIYAHPEASVATLVQQFAPGEWQLDGALDENSNSLRFLVELEDLDQVADDKVWVQLAVDGVLQEGLTPLSTNEPGISVEGWVESRISGFKFPDGTTQSSAGIAVGDNLGDHTATQNIQLGSSWLSGDGGNAGIRVNGGGKVGVATAPGSANLQVAGTDGVLFGGTLNSGTIPGSGAGTRMMWYPKKAAFRVGYIDGTQWNDVSIGNYSTAMGYNTTASYHGSTAMGYNTTASDFASTAMGYFTTASSNYSTAMGYNTTASSSFSTAIGYSTIASGDASTAMGDNTTAPSYTETVLGRYNTTYTTASTFSWDTSDRLFVIGNGTSSILRSDAMVILKNGDIGIGFANPQALLHLAGGGDDCSPAMGGKLISGSTDSINICIDENEIMARNNGGTSPLYLNNEGGEIIFGGPLNLATLLNGGATDICRNASNYLAACSSSGRYKNNIQALELGLDTIQKLQPVSFDWTEGGAHDLGFVAEDVAAIDPLLVTHNASGEIEGVKYKQLTAVLVNAIQTQQTQHAALQTRHIALQKNHQKLQLELANLQKQQQLNSRLVLEIKQQLEQRPLLTSLDPN